jgi:hypothetical protein
MLWIKVKYISSFVENGTLNLWKLFIVPTTGYYSK